MKKTLSIILTVLMLVTMIPMAVMPANAAEHLDYNITVEVVDWAVYETSGELIGEFNAVDHGDAFYDVSLTQADDGTFTFSYRIALERNGDNTAWDESSISFKIDSCEDEFLQEFEKSCYSNYNIFYNLKVTRSADHSFSDWADVGDGTHTRTCSICSETETQNHSFEGANCLTVGKCDCGLSSIDSNVHTKPVKYVVNSENNFKHDEVYECCGLVNSDLDHKYDSKGMCKECEYQCAHSSFTDSICDSCGYNSDVIVIDGTLGGKTTATEDDVNTLLEQLKGYVDSGITTIIVTGSEPALHNFYGIDTSAVSAALYYLADGRSDSPYCGTIDLILPDVTEIVDDEFNNTFALNSITLPKVTTVGDGAFYATLYLKKLTFGSVITFVNEKSSGPFHMDGYEVGGCDLVLNCGQLQAEDKYKPNFETNVWFVGDWSGEYEWKSITLTHTGGEATCVAKAVCETCGEEYGEADPDAHIWKFGECTECGYDCEHSFTKYTETKAPTCTEAGREDSPCDYCDAMNYNTIPELNHKDTLVQVEAQAKTCTTVGWDAYEYCTACDYTTYKEIPAGHTPLEAVKENEVAPKCGVAGSYDLVVYCDACGEELDRDTTTVDALTHEDADGDYLCDNGCGHEFEKPVAPTPDTPDTPDEPDTPNEPTDDDCDHMCHKDGILGFLWKIIRFFTMLFKTNPVCECGVAHY